MEAIYRGTTPRLLINLDTNISGWVIKTTIQSGGKKIEIPQSRLTITATTTGCTIDFRLEQSETLKMSTKALVKIKAKRPADGEVVTSTREYFKVLGDINNEVIE